MNERDTLRGLLYGVQSHVHVLHALEGGQIVLLRRQLGAWPPPRGGDTW
jgi:hypothetical protein